ncbi:MAG: PTS lactose/cellobiose transporter subunit IIA [Longicatena sp.]
MGIVSKEELNNAAMQIILHAGDCRNYLSEAIHMSENDEDILMIDLKLKEAKEEITKAHKIQTEMIQNTIENDDMITIYSCSRYSYDYI